jgi:hypothetical protein
MAFYLFSNHRNEIGAECVVIAEKTEDELSFALRNDTAVYLVVEMPQLESQNSTEGDSLLSAIVFPIDRRNVDRPMIE